MIIDILIVAVILLFAAIGVKRGIAKTLLNIAGIVVTAVCAYYLSDFLSQVIYDAFIKQTVISNVTQIIEENGLDYALSNSLLALPEWLSGFIIFVSSLFGINETKLQDSLVFSDEISSSSSNMIESAVAPLATSLLSFILIIVLFIIIFILVKKLIKLVAKAFSIPVIKQINQLLGGVFGIAEGLIIVWIAVNILSLAAVLSEQNTIESVLLQSTLFKFFSVAV